MLGNEGRPANLDPIGTWGEVLRQMTAARDALTPPSASVAAGGGPAPPPVDPQTLALLGQAWLVVVTSGIRYWAHAAETWAKLLAAVPRSFTAKSGDLAEADATLIDEFRARLRELADLPCQESRRIQAELDDIVQRLSPDASQKASSGYWRRWTVKP